MTTAFLVFLTVVPGSLSDLLIAAGMKQQGEITDWSLRGLARIGCRLIRNFYILTSIPAMALSFFALMALISATDISFAVPVTAASYIIDAAFARTFLRENVEWHRWAGISLVAFGIAMLSR